jgi:hypothetical protein
MSLVEGLTVKVERLTVEIESDDGSSITVGHPYGLAEQGSAAYHIELVWDGDQVNGPTR